MTMTIVELVQRVHESAVTLGMDVSPKDVAFIISAFLESMAAEPSQPQVNAWLIAIADEVNKTRDT